MNSIPPEILSWIFSFLSVFDRVHTCRSVSRKWKCMVDENAFWKSRTLRDFQNVASYCTIPSWRYFYQRCYVMEGETRSLLCRLFFDKEIREVARTCATLRWAPLFIAEEIYDSVRYKPFDDNEQMLRYYSTLLMNFLFLRGNVEYSVENMIGFLYVLKYRLIIGFSLDISEILSTSQWKFTSADPFMNNFLPRKRDILLFIPKFTSTISNVVINARNDLIRESSNYHETEQRVYAGVDMNTDTLLFRTCEGHKPRDGNDIV